jgi:hypothetical protein
LFLRLQTILIGGIFIGSAQPSIAQIKWSTIDPGHQSRSSWRLINSDQPSVTNGLTRSERSTNALAFSPIPSNQVDPPETPEVSRASALEPIAPFVKVERPWPSPSLNPGVPSAFIANTGDFFAVFSGATPGKLRSNDVDGSLLAGFGVGDSARFAALELSVGCGSINRFCGNGEFSARVSRLLVNQPKTRVSIAAGWQHVGQWGYEGKQDDLVYGAISYAIPLRSPFSTYAQTLQLNAGLGNSTLAPYSNSDSETKLGGFFSAGVELSPGFGISAGWSGRGVNALASYTPFRSLPITLNLLGADLLSQTPAGAVAVFSIGWGGNFSTPNFESPLLLENIN